MFPGSAPVEDKGVSGCRLWLSTVALQLLLLPLRQSGLLPQVSPQQSFLRGGGSALPGGRGRTLSEGKCSICYW